MSFKSFLQKKRISSVWIVPIITIFIALWLVAAHFYDKGLEITLFTKDANGIVAGKTIIKNRNVDIGIVTSVSLSSDFETVIIKASIDRNMDNLVRNDSVFALIQPQISVEGISGLGTLLSGVYIELFSGQDRSAVIKEKFELFDTPPLSTALENGLTIKLESQQSNVIPVGSSVLFKGYNVGRVTHSKLNVESREMEYLVNIEKPFDSLVTSNVRFWKEGSIDLSLTPNGASLGIPPLDVLLSGGVSFDIPENANIGTPIADGGVFKLYDSKEDIQNSQYTESYYFLLFFDESISGLAEGSPVQYRGIQLGVVEKAPFFNKKLLDSLSVLNYEIPVLIRIEPQRINDDVGDPALLAELLIKEQANGLRATLKSNNLLTNSLYVDVDFYPETTKSKFVYQKKYGYDTITTIPAGLSQIQNKITQFLTTINELPLNKMSQELNQTLQSLNKTLNSFQAGSELYNQLQNNSQKFDQFMNQFQKLLTTLNEKSNALIMPVRSEPDRIPKAKGK